MIWRVDMKINKIKKSGNKYKITLDDNSEITTYDDVIINYGLLYNKNIDPETLNKINNDNIYYDAYYKTVNYITKKLRSEKEVITYLNNYNVNIQDQEKIIKKLKEINLINDLNFTKAYIADRLNLSSDGKDKIKTTLYYHNIDPQIIAEQLAKIDQKTIDDRIEKIILKKSKNTKYCGYKLKSKLLNDLVNMGYDRNDITRILNETDTTKSIQEEYYKIHSKLSKKYEGKELIYKIKKKLYNEGFTTEQINSAVEDSC